MIYGAGDGSRTREHLRDRVLSPAPLTSWQPPRLQSILVPNPPRQSESELSTAS